MSKRVKVVSLVWISICIALTVFGVSQNLGGNPEGGIVPGALVLILSSPIGYFSAVLCSYVFVLLREAGHVSANPKYLDLLVHIVMIGSGYWQWFIFLPKMNARLKKWRESKRNSSAIR